MLTALLSLQQSSNTIKQLIQLLLLHTDARVRLIFVWEETGVPGVNQPVGPCDYADAHHTGRTLVSSPGHSDDRRLGYQYAIRTVDLLNQPRPHNSHTS